MAWTEIKIICLSWLGCGTYFVCCAQCNLLFFKCGRTQKELTSLHSECEIQKHHHHRNIIQMITSFETETEVSNITLIFVLLQI